MAEERSEGATTEGLSVTSTVDANERAPWGRCIGSFRRWWSGGLELATSRGDKLGKRNRAHVTLIAKRQPATPIRNLRLAPKQRVAF
jgi:hypothetical protein